MTFGIPFNDADNGYIRCPKGDHHITPRLVVPYHDEIVRGNEKDCMDIESICKFSERTNTIIPVNEYFHFVQETKIQSSIDHTMQSSNNVVGAAFQIAKQVNNEKDQNNTDRDNARSMESSRAPQERRFGNEARSPKENSSGNRDESKEDKYGNSTSNENNEDKTKPAANIATPWSEELHRQLVEAVYEIGISHASPAVIMEHMRLLNTGDYKASGVGGRNVNNNPVIAAAVTDPAANNSTSSRFGRQESIINSGSLGNSKSETNDINSQEAESNVSSGDVTSERVKSHLQKYRKNKHKSKEEFMSEYDAWLQNALGSKDTDGGLPLSITNVDVMGKSGKTLLGGEFAAFLTHTVMTEEVEGVNSKKDERVAFNPREDQPVRSPTNNASRQNQGETSSDSVSRKRVLSEIQVEGDNPSRSKRMVGARIPFPVLTDDEKNSYLGESICHIASLFYSMTNHLAKVREEKEGLHPADTEVPTSVSPCHNQQTNVPCSDSSVADDSAASINKNTQQPWVDSPAQKKIIPREGHREDDTSSRTRSIPAERRLSDPQTFRRNTSSMVSIPQSDGYRYRMQTQQHYVPVSRSGQQYHYDTVLPRTKQPVSVSRQDPIVNDCPPSRHEAQSKQRLVNFNWHRYDESGARNREASGPSTAHPSPPQQRHPPRQYLSHSLQQQTSLPPPPPPPSRQQSEIGRTDRYLQNSSPLTSIYESYYSDFQPLPSDQDGNV